MSTQQPRSIFQRLGISPQALPIAAKIAIALVITLLISGMTVNLIARNTVLQTEQEVVFEDLQQFSEAQALRFTDILGQEIIALTRVANSEDVQQLMLDLRTVQADGEPLQLDEAAVREMAEVRNTRDELYTIAMVNPNGVVIGIDPLPEEAVAIDRSQWQWFDEAFADGDGAIYVAALETDFLTGRRGVHIAVPVYDEFNESGNLIGVIYTVWNLNNVTGIARGVGERQVTIATTEGQVLVSDTGLMGDDLPIRVRSELQESQTAFRVTLPDGQEWLYGFVRIDDSIGLSDTNAVTNLELVVLTREPYQVVVNTTNAIVANLRGAIAGTVAFSIIVVLLIARVVTRPLNRLTETAELIAQGNINVDIPDLPDDEVGQLGEVMQALIDRLAYRINRLNAAVQVSRATSATTDIDQVMRRIARALVEQFDLPDVRVYLTETHGDRARLTTAIGPEGERLLRQGHSVLVNMNNPIGKAIIMRDVQYEGGFDAPAFAGANVKPAELILPLRAGGDVLGVLHLIADRAGAFDTTDVDILSLVADQVGSAIENARLFERSQENLDEIEALNRRLTEEAWVEYLDDIAELRYTTDPEERWPTPPERATSLVSDRELAQATTYSDPDGRSILAAPLLLRGEAIGLLAVARPQGSRWTQDEIAVMESIASRMALIAEGIRLVEQTSRRAQREQRISEVSASIFQQTGSVEDILRGALSELGTAMGSEHISVRLGSPPLDDDRQIGAGNGAMNENREDEEGDDAE